MIVIVKSIFLETALGRFKLQVSVRPENPDITKVTLEERKPSQKLPQGMSVERCRAIVLSIRGATQIHHLAFSCSLENDELPGFLCTGEGLEAQEWEDSRNLVVVGTEDAVWLNARLPFLDCEDQDIVSYSKNSITLELTDIPPCQELSLHFVIAENLSPEPVECSAWFAVDCPHKLLI